jgi:hypothetical protein
MKESEFLGALKRYSWNPKKAEKEKSQGAVMKEGEARSANVGAFVRIS